ncbi:MAG TPA: DUF2147 domain-containing protein [bacterium]|nr:DUF2147 domain-containing protein [bacterium]
MRKYGILALLIVGLIFSGIVLGNDYDNTPVGYWKTIDEETKEAKSIVKIWESEEGTLSGKILKTYPEPGEDPNPICEECEGERKNQPIIGMEFMWNFSGSGSQWKEGKILDPENGKIYNCKLEVTENGKKMKVFGYIKLLVKIGRTQVWHRTEKPEIEQ